MRVAVWVFDRAKLLRWHRPKQVVVLHAAFVERILLAPIAAVRHQLVHEVGPASYAPLCQAIANVVLIFESIGTRLGRVLDEDDTIGKDRILAFDRRKQLH